MPRKRSVKKPSKPKRFKVRAKMVRKKKFIPMINFSFPEHGVSISAPTKKEAIKKLKSQLKEN